MMSKTMETPYPNSPLQKWVQTCFTWPNNFELFYCITFSWLFLSSSLCLNWLFYLIILSISYCDNYFGLGLTGAGYFAPICQLFNKSLYLNSSKKSIRGHLHKKKYYALDLVHIYSILVLLPLINLILLITSDQISVNQWVSWFMIYIYNKVQKCLRRSPTAQNRATAGSAGSATSKTTNSSAKLTSNTSGIASTFTDSSRCSTTISTSRIIQRRPRNDTSTRSPRRRIARRWEVTLPFIQISVHLPIGNRYLRTHPCSIHSHP